MYGNSDFTVEIISIYYQTFVRENYFILRSQNIYYHLKGNILLNNKVIGFWNIRLVSSSITWTYITMILNIQLF